MKLIGIDCQIPSNQIFNEDVIELIKYHSASSYDGKLSELDTLVRKFLLLTGIESRFWRQKKEKPIDLIIQCVNTALEKACLQKQDIDLIIYSSIDRGFIEPANASFICKTIGFSNVRSFDVVDACMGWASAVQIANSFLSSSQSINSILIINAEFPMDDKGTVLPNNFKIQNKNDLKWKSPSFTLGEGTSACIFQKDLNNSSKFEFIELSDYANLCTIPLLNYEKYIDESKEAFFPDELQFYANGAALLEYGTKPALEVIHTLLNKLDYTPKIIFPHSVSNKVIQEISSKAEITSLMYSTFSKLGNIATVSIPSAIKKALLNNVINQNDKCLGWVASAGMKFAAFEIQM
jgi:3-oxoacyl-[acyl-carrier-protein] synthase III